ncbi:hypothetical protein ALC56_00622, partial [Trachymyrmex septentrionalis]
GVGIYFPTLQLNHSYRFPAGTSIFTAEAWVLLVAVKMICEEHCFRVVIFTDSKSVLEAIALPRTLAKSIFTRQFRDYLDGEFLQKGLLYEQYYQDSSPKTWYAKLHLKREEIILTTSDLIINCIDKTFPNSPRDIFPLLKKPSVKMCRLLLAFFKAINLRI